MHDDWMGRGWSGELEVGMMQMKHRGGFYKKRRILRVSRKARAGNSCAVTVHRLEDSKYLPHRRYASTTQRTRQPVHA